MAEAGGWVDVLGLGPREHVAVVGGGGKSTLCYLLARALARAGRRVIATTTTKVRRSEAESLPMLLFLSGDPVVDDRWRENLKEQGCVFVAERLLDSGKVQGISPEAADAFFQDPEVDGVIVEADGAAGRPVKAPAGHEPVIPASTTLVIAVMGLEAMGMPVSLETVFRLDCFRAITGLGLGDPLTAPAAASLFQSPEGLFKGALAGARRIAWLNKADRLASNEVPEELARLLLQPPRPVVERVVVGSLIEGSCRIYRRLTAGGPAACRRICLEVS